MGKLLSFVIPCYRSEHTISSVVDEIIKTVSRREGYDYEIICVNDASPDNVYSVLLNLAENNKKIKVVNFAKNMGKHNAVIAGYSYVSGDYIINLDDDFQCPTYELWKFVDLLEKDMCDVVTAVYRKKKQALWKNLGSDVNMLMSETLLGKPKGLRFENFNAMKRFVVNEIVKYKNPYPYLEGLLLRVTDNIMTVEMEERERADSNSSGYTLLKSISLWINGFTAFSVKPLRISAMLGLIFSCIAFVIGVIMIIRKILNPAIAIGYTSLVVVQLFVGSVILIFLGLIGEYLGRVYICLNNSPQYVVKNVINLDNTQKNKKH